MKGPQPLSIRAWFPFYGSDFYGSFKVRAMSLEEEAVYMRLLWIAWNDPNCSLPADVVELKRLSGFSGDLKRVQNCFFRKRGRLYNARLLKEWHKAKEKSRKATESINERWAYGRNTDVQRPLYSSPSPSPLPSQKEKKEEEATVRKETAPTSPTPDEYISGFSLKKKSTAQKIPKTARDDPDFEACYAAYPRHEGGKTKIREAWDKAKDRPALEILLAAIEKQRHGETWAKGFVPHMTTWLNQGRWTDKPTAMRDDQLCQNMVEEESMTRKCLKLAYQPKGDDKESKIPRCLSCYEQFWKVHGRRVFRVSL